MADTKVVTGECRGSYVNVFNPRLNELSGKEEYSMTLLIPKSDKGTLADLEAAAEAAKEKRWGAKVPKGVLSPIHDGDGDKPNGGSYGPECSDHWVVNVKSNRQPKVVDKNVRPVLDPFDFESGDYCRASLNAYAYDNKRKGFSFGLNNVQVIRKGDALGSSTNPEDEFDTVAVEDEF